MYFIIDYTRYGFQAPECRFGAPWKVTDDVSIDSKVNKGRIRIKISTPRNNEFINRHAAAPHVDCAANSNTDFTLISDPFGAGSYVASYSSKAEAPDSDIMMKMMMRSLANPEHRTHRDIFRATANAMLGAVQVGATQAMFVLLNLKFINSSRSTITLNTLRREDVTQRVLTVDELRERIEIEGSKASAVDASPHSSLGKRAVYSEVLKQQGPDSDLTMFALYSSYRVSVHSKGVSACSIEGEEEGCDENIEGDGEEDDKDEDGDTSMLDTSATQKGKRKISKPRKSSTVWVINPTLRMDGLFLDRASSNNFQVKKYRFSQLKNGQRVIVHMSPFISFEPENDRCAYSLLLLHVPWPNGDEASIVPNGTTASKHLAALQEANKLPAALLQFIEQSVSIQKARNEMGMPTEGMHSAHMDDGNDDQGTSDSDDDDGGCPDLGEENESGDATAAAAIDALDLLSNFTSGTECVVDLTDLQYKSGKDYIAKLTRIAAEKLSKENKFSDKDSQARSKDPRTVCKYDNHQKMKEELDALIRSMNTLQLRAYERFTQSFEKRDKPEQLLMTISGEAGTGKSYITQAIRLFTKIRFGKTNSAIGPILVVAPTGSAAYNVNGYTWQSVLNKSKQDKGSVLKKVSQHVSNQLQGKLDGLQVVIIDEMSLINLESLVDINRRLQAAQRDKTRQQMLFGGCTVILMGDFYQVRKNSS